MSDYYAFFHVKRLNSFCTFIGGKMAEALGPYTSM